MKFLAVTAAILVGLVSTSTYGEETFYRSNPRITGYSVPLNFTISDKYLQNLSKQTWAGGRKSFRMRDEWIMYGNAAEDETNFALSIMQRTPKNTMKYRVHDVVRSFNMLKNKQFHLAKKQSKFDTDLGIFDLALMKFRYHHIEKICIVFSSNEVDNRLFLKGYYCRAKGAPHPFALRCILHSLNAPKFGIEAKQEKECNGSIPKFYADYEKLLNEKKQKLKMKRGLTIVTRS